jgi:hypothetical protein
MSQRLVRACAKVFCRLGGSMMSFIGSLVRSRHFQGILKDAMVKR